MHKLHLILIALIVIATIGLAETTISSGGNVVRMTATGDKATITRKVIKQVKVVPMATGKVYELREGSTTGTVMWEHSSHASTLENPKAETVSIKTGASDTYFVTDDPTATLTLQY